MGGGINAEYMGTHPIFESDFDCLTERQNKKETNSLLSFELSQINIHTEHRQVTKRKKNLKRK